MKYTLLKHISLLNQYNVFQIKIITGKRGEKSVLHIVGDEKEF